MKHLCALVINEDVNIQKILTLLLLRDGFEPVFATNSRDGLAQFISRQPDVVLLDWALPDMKPEDVARNIRKHEKGGSKHTLIVATTTYADRDFVQAIHTAGIDGYLQQPIQPKTLSTYLQRLIAQ